MRNNKLPSYSARWLVKRLLAEGIPLNRLFKGTRLSEAWLQNENALITPADYLVIVQNALNESGDPALALRLGQKPNLGDLGVWGYAILSSPTLGEANQIALQFWELSGSLVKLSYKKEPPYSTWKIFPAFPMDSLRSWRFAVEELLATFFSDAGFLSSEALPISEIHLSYPEPVHGPLYRKLFKCPVYFDRAENLFRTAVDFEKIPSATGNLFIAEISKKLCRKFLKKFNATDEFISSIRNILMTSLGQFPGLAQTAAQLAMSPRTLRRRLKERHTTYQRLLDEIRTELTKEYLSMTNLSVDQIATRMGFSEATTLRRAFKKWTGTSVKTFKKMKKP